jgi:hypothetical protein
LQIIAYADDVVLIARIREDQVEGFHSLESAAVRMGLKINENRTKIWLCAQEGCWTHLFWK